MHTFIELSKCATDLAANLALKNVTDPLVDGVKNASHLSIGNPKRSGAKVPFYATRKTSMRSSPVNPRFWLINTVQEISVKKKASAKIRVQKLIVLEAMQQHMWFSAISRLQENKNRTNIQWSFCKATITVAKPTISCA